MSTFEYLKETNRRFLSDFFDASKLDKSEISAVPTALFVVFSFVLIYNLTHRRATHLMSLKICLYKGMGFQWTHFYVMRIWFLLVKGFRWLSGNIEDYFGIRRKQHGKNVLLKFSQATLYLVLIALSVFPLVIIIMNCLHKQNIPNFLMWVEEDPWIRSEIGISGHYLERPPHFLPKQKEYAYRSRRSISVENTNLRTPVLRNCRSMVVFSHLKSTAELT